MGTYGIVNLATAVPVRSAVVRLAAPDGEPLLGRAGFADTLGVGPWLVDLDRVPGVLKAWNKEGRWKDWGYMVHSDLDLSALVRHFKKFNYVEVEGEKERFLFRYFDTVIFLDFIVNVADDEQAAAFFKGIQRISVEDKNSKEILDVLPPDP